MFTVNWTQPAKYAKSAVQHSNGYWYTDSTLYQTAIPLSGGVSYNGYGETVELALADLRSKIEAGLSKNRDKPVLEALDAFDAATK